METMEDADAVETFQAITGADNATAQHVLEAHGWDLNRSVNFFMESAGMPAARAQDEEEQQAQPSGLPQEVIDLDGPEVREDNRELPTARLRQNLGPSGAILPSTWVDEDEELQAAMNASLRTDEDGANTPRVQKSRHSRRQTMDYEGDDDNDNDDDYVAVERPPPQPSSRSNSSSTYLGLPRGFLDDSPAEPRVRRNRPRGAALPDPDMSHLAAMGLAAGFPRPQLFNGSGQASPVRAENGNGHQDFPAGINMEEARMLEAAMLGIPYEGRMPDFRNPEALEPVSPSVLHQRQLREEQDQAYQESLLADKQKADAEEAVRRAEADKQRQFRQAEEDAAQVQRDYERAISEKLASLPEEPAADHPDAINVMIRTPSGGRFGRRFLRSNKFGDLFNFVDVNAAPEIKPATYNLVTQFPRRVFETGREGTLAEAGLTQKQEAIFLEPL